MSSEQLLLDGLTFPEGPRWHDGHLWFSDLRARSVSRVDLDGQAQVVTTLDDSPSGLGFLPDGTPLVVSMRDRALYRIVDGGLQTHADLGHLPGDFLNDMVVDEDGRAYVGVRSRDLYPGMPGDLNDGPDLIAIVDPDGGIRIGASGLVAPNGTVITPDGTTLIVAETYANRILAFARKDDGSLTDRRIFANVPGRYPDGICLDEEGGVWLGSPYTDEIVRVMDGGQATEQRRIRGAVACALGGPSRSTLFVLCVDPDALPPVGRRSAQATRRDKDRHGGKIWTVPVTHAGAGWP